MQGIKQNAPSGATHYDEQDYWKREGEKWFIWLESINQWRQIFSVKRFHESIPIKPL